MAPNNTGNRDRKQALVAALTLLGASLGINTHADAKGLDAFIKIDESKTSTQHKDKPHAIVDTHLKIDAPSSVKGPKLDGSSKDTVVKSNQYKKASDTPSAFFIKKSADTPSALYMKKNAVKSKQDEWTITQRKTFPAATATHVKTDVHRDNHPDATVNWGDGTTSSDQKKIPAPGKAR